VQARGPMMQGRVTEAMESPLMPGQTVEKSIQGWLMRGRFPARPRNAWCDLMLEWFVSRVATSPSLFSTRSLGRPILPGF